MKNKLSHLQLKRFLDYKDIPFETTKEVTPDYNIKAQPRYEKSMELGLNIKNEGFNIFVLGEDCLGKTTYTEKMVRDLAKTEEFNYDYCMINNFQDEQSPITVKLKKGDAIKLKNDMENKLNYLKKDFDLYSLLPNIEHKREKMLMEYQRYKDEVILTLVEEMRKFDFAIKSTKQGIFLMPILDDKILSEEEVEKLSEEEKIDINRRSELIHDDLQKIIRELTEEENKVYDKIDNYDKTEFTLFFGKFFSDIVEKYCMYDEIIQYIKGVKESLTKNVCKFLQNKDAETSLKLKTDLDKYKINILVDNSETVGKPVIFAKDCTVQSLIGNVEFSNEFGIYTTDFMKYKSGLLYKANGGYLILNAFDLFSNRYSYEVIKRVLQEKKINFDLIVEFTGLNRRLLNTEDVDIDVKVIIIGNYNYYDILTHYDDEFDKFFKVIAELNNTMNYSQESLKDFYEVVKKFVDEQNTRDITSKGIVKLIEYSTKITESQNKLTTHFNYIEDIIIEANFYAQKENEEYITDKHIQTALSEKEYRANIYEEKIDELIDENVIMIDTKDARVGQINALSVIDTGDYTFGRPTKITATTYSGEEGICNIEKESELSGKIHDKGVNIIEGFLGQTFAQDFPLSLSCNICFEQNYGGVDGDSASSTELYTILSSLSDVPIKQYIAVTGSVNQWGEIQAVGGVTYKIEGFYDLCKKRGLSGEEGVIIPKQNISELILKDEIIQDVKAGNFNIYAVSHIEEGIEILTGEKFGTKNEKGEFEKNTISYKIYNKLKKFNEEMNEE